MPELIFSTKRMSFGGAVNACLRKYADFEGRASRAEYWWWALFTFSLGLIIGLFSVATHTTNLTNLLVILATLALILPSLAVAVRRIHDIGRSGWALLMPWFVLMLSVLAALPLAFINQQLAVVGYVIAAIVFIAAYIVRFCWLVQPDSPTVNRYGNSPHAQ